MCVCRCAAGRGGVAGDQQGAGIGRRQAHQPRRRGPDLHLQDLRGRSGQRRPRAEQHPGAAAKERNRQRGAHVQGGAGSCTVSEDIFISCLTTLEVFFDNWITKLRKE